MHISIRVATDHHKKFQSTLATLFKAQPSAATNCTYKVCRNWNLQFCFHLTWHYRRYSLPLCYGNIRTRYVVWSQELIPCQSIQLLANSSFFNITSVFPFHVSPLCSKLALSCLGCFSAEHARRNTGKQTCQTLFTTCFPS